MVIKKNERIAKEENNEYTIFDYKLGSIATGINVYEIKGRMPEKNYMISRKTDRVFIVLKGTGIVYVDSIARTVEEGDVVFVSVGAKFYFEGDLTLAGLKSVNK